MPHSNFNLLVILGPTASGKTSLAAKAAMKINGEIISADSRQVYKQLTIGTGKDYKDYQLEGNIIPCHLIDIAEPGSQYNVFEFQRDFLKVFDDIQLRNKFPILCGGSGMYIEAVIQGYRLIQVPVNDPLREVLENKTIGELAVILKGLKKLHANSDLDTEKRAIRAIEIETYYGTHPEIDRSYPEIKPLLVGIKTDRDIQRELITKRLKQRLDEGMIEEVRGLLSTGITPDQLIYYGLEYKYITRFVIGEIDYDTMFSSLNTAIHQFAKRQMTWFRRMESRGMNIHWIEGTPEEKVERIMELGFGNSMEIM